MYQCHARLLDQLRAHLHGDRALLRDLETLPAWVTVPSTPVEVVAGSLDLREAMAATQQLRGLCQALEAELARAAPPVPTAHAPAATPDMDPCLAVALTRLALGDLLECFVGLRTHAVCGVHDTLRDPHARATARLFQDSYLMAVWTSAHAQYVATVFDLLAHDRARVEGLVNDPEPREQPCARLGNACAHFGVPAPELHLVPCVSNTPDVGPLCERAAAPRTCTKTSQPLIAVLARATNAGSRGWEATLNAALQSSEGAVRLCHHAVQVALSGLHPCVHPLARPTWRQRLGILRGNPLSLQRGEVQAFAKVASNMVKEAIRLCIGTLLNEDMATLMAYVETNQPMAQLEMPPLAMPAASMRACMQTFASVGIELLQTPCTVAELAERLTGTLSSEPRSRKKAGAAAASGGPAPAVSYCCSWMGGRAGSVATTLSVSTVLSGLLAASFRAEYTLFWMHAAAGEERPSRLDDAQYRALHHRSPFHEMVGLLARPLMLRAQRLALRMPQASLLTVRDVASILRLSELPSADVSGTTSTSNRAVQEGEATIMRLDGSSVAQLVVFAQTAALRSQMLAYDLGETTRRRQIRALARRFLVPMETLDLDLGLMGTEEGERIVGSLPRHATHVFVCSECRRIVNACHAGGGKEVPFNELGLSASMLRIDTALAEGEMRCAKRSSAALRTAVTLEEQADARQVECQPCARPDAASMPPDLRPASVVAAGSDTAAKEEEKEGEDKGPEPASDVAKLRRDIKNCLEQHPRAVACGDVPLVSVDVLGRCVRLFDDWYCLCALCGALMRTAPSSRFGGEPCCQRCDFAMLFGKELETRLLEQQPKPAPPSCRLCGKPQPPGSGSKWRVVSAPADTGGRNASVPPPLRKCWCASFPFEPTRPATQCPLLPCRYCPTHWRAWLPTAHLELPTNVIFAHIVSRAKPMFGAQTGKRNLFEAIAQVDDEKERERQQQRPGERADEGGERGKRRRRSAAPPVVEGPSKQSRARARMLRKTKPGR